MRQRRSWCIECRSCLRCYRLTARTTEPGFLSVCAIAVRKDRDIYRELFSCLQDTMKTCKVLTASQDSHFEAASAPRSLARHSLQKHRP